MNGTCLRELWQADSRRVGRFACRWCCRTACALLAILVASQSWAQLPYGRLDWIYPPGGKAGSEFDVTIGGGDVDVAERLVFSHPGIVAYQKKTAPNEFEPSYPIPNQFTLRIAEGVPSGIYDAQAVGRFGASTPRAFQVGDTLERVEPGDNTSLEKAFEVATGTTVNGRADANSADYYRIKLSANQRLLVTVAAERIDSQMDATLVMLDAQGRELTISRDYVDLDPLVDFFAPSDGDYIIKVFDFTYQGGNNHFYRLHLDNGPHVEFAFPPAIEPGDTAKVAIYGWNLPGGQPQDAWKVDGRPLERMEATITAPPLDPLGRGTDNPQPAKPYASELQGFVHRARTSAGETNPFFMGLATVPVIPEAADNDNSASPQQIELPCEVAGQFYPARDDDWFEFTAKKGENWWIEVISQRLGLPTDPFLLVQRVQAKDDGTLQVSDVAAVDDAPKRPGGAGYDEAPADPIYRLAVNEDGRYRVLVRDMLGQSRARPQHLYRLAIRPADPDFHLLVTPPSPWNPDPKQPLRWNPVLRRGSSIALSVAALRRDGFDGQIELTVAGLPRGVSAPTAIIGPGSNEGVIVISATDSAETTTSQIEVLGKSVEDGRTIVREAEFASLTWDAPSQNARETARVARNMVLRVADEIAPIEVALGDNPLRETSRGGKLTIPIQVTRRGEIKDKVTLAGYQLPAGVKAEVKLDDNAATGELVLTVEPAAKPGTYSFCVAGKTKVSYRRNGADADTAEEARKALESKVGEIAAAQQAAAEALASAETQFTQLNDALEKNKQELAALTQQENPPAEIRAQVQQHVDEAGRQRAEAEAKKNAAAAAAKTAQEKHSAAQEALNRLAERAKQLAEAAKPTDRGAYTVSTPVTLRIAESPIVLSTNAAEIALTQGTEQRLTVSLDRRYGFTDAVRIEPAIADGNAKLSSVAMDVAGEQKSGELTLKAAPDAPPGSRTVTLKAKLKFNGVDLEVTKNIVVKVIAPQPAEEKKE